MEAILVEPSLFAPDAKKSEPWSQETSWTQLTGPSSHGGSQVYCDACFSCEYENGDDGFYYCRRCGSLIAGLVETDVAMEDICGTGEAVGDGALYNLRHRIQVTARDYTQTPASLPTWEEIIRDLAGGPKKEKDENEGRMERENSYQFEEKVYEPQDFGMRKHPSAESLVNGIRLRYVQGLQLIIEIQCEALVEKFGVSPLICRFVGGVWQRFLVTTRVFDEGWVNKVIEESEEALRQQAGEGDPADRHIHRKWEPHNIYGQRAIYIWLRYLKKAVPLHSSLAICFLACHIARQSILPTDIVKWALDAKLPYISAFVEIDRLLGKTSRTCPLSSRTLFRPVTAIGAWQLETMAGTIARSIHLDLPPVNFYALAGRYLKELSVPTEKILPTVCRIYEWSIPVDLQLPANYHRLPTRVYVMAILIVAMRLLYNMHGQGVWEMSLPSSRSSSNNQDPDLVHLKKKKKADQDLDCIDLAGSCDLNSRSWESKNFCTTKASVEETVTKIYLRSVSSVTGSEFNTRELLSNLEAAYDKNNVKHDYSDDYTTYLAYCKDVISAGVSKQYVEETLMERFWNLYEKRLENNQVGQYEPLVSIKKRSREVRGVEQENNIPERLRVETHDKPTSMSDLDNAEAAALRMLKADMEQNGFIYIPPKAHQGVEDFYLHYSRKNAHGKFYYVAHADYYILLRSCARLAEIDCRLMHLGVLSFEKRLKWTESRISNSLASLHDGSVDAMLEKFKNLCHGVDCPSA